MCENVVHGTEHDHENRKNGRMCLQSSTMSEHIEITPEIIEIRHYLHAHPERSFKEYETSAYIEKLLRAHDIEVLNNPLETGVVGLIRGDQPGPRIALRADIDGLPIQEDTGLPFSSVNDGVMHGCGHDLHMSYMLGAAFWLVKRRKHIKGSIKLLFQPAEELGLGAKAMVDAGLLADVSAAIGAHNNPNYAPGQIAVGPEPMMAGCVKFHVTLHATGTHAGYPHKGTGPIEALATLVLALQTVTYRRSIRSCCLSPKCTAATCGTSYPTRRASKAPYDTSTSPTVNWWRNASSNRSSPLRPVTASPPTSIGTTSRIRSSPIRNFPR